VFDLLRSIRYRPSKAFCNIASCLAKLGSTQSGQNLTSEALVRHWVPSVALRLVTSPAKRTQEMMGCNAKAWRDWASITKINSRCWPVCVGKAIPKEPTTKASKDLPGRRPWHVIKVRRELGRSDGLPAGQGRVAQLANQEEAWRCIGSRIIVAKKWSNAQRRGTRVDTRWQRYSHSEVKLWRQQESSG